MKTQVIHRQTAPQLSDDERQHLAEAEAVITDDPRTLRFGEGWP